MRFPIGVIFPRRDGRVVNVRRAMPAGRMSASLGAFSIVEMSAGAADHAGHVGDRLVAR